MKRASIVLVVLAALTVGAAAQAPQVQVPAENNPRATTPPARPPVGEAEASARQLFLAIQRDDPALARDFFFPRDAFLVLKGIADPARYWGILMSHYERDIHELHGSLPGISDGTFDRFTLSRRGGWVAIREEANALPYWASRHSWIYYRAGDREQRFEIRTLINWGPRWYVTHLR